MSFQAEVDQPISGSQWVEKRRQSLSDQLGKLIVIRRSLEEKQLWRPKDEARLDRLLFQLADYLKAIGVDPDRFQASERDLCFEGPSFMAPGRSGCFTSPPYVCRMDALFDLLTELAGTRLCYDRMVNSPPAPPVAEMSPDIIRWRSLQSHEKFIFEDFENRPHYRSYLEEMEMQLEKASARELDAQEPCVARYQLDVLTIEVTGATRLRLKHLSPAMTPTELLAATQVADRLPCQATRRPRPTWGDSAEAFRQYSENFSTDFTRFRQEYKASWRELTDAEIAEILRRCEIARALEDAGKTALKHSVSCLCHLVF